MAIRMVTVPWDIAVKCEDDYSGWWWTAASLLRGIDVSSSYYSAQDLK